MTDLHECIFAICYTVHVNKGHNIDNKLWFNVYRNSFHLNTNIG